MEREFYQIRSLLGNSWAMFYILLGGRQAGKSYSVTDFFVSQYKKYKTPFYWLRLKPAQCDKLLKNGAEKLVDPDLRRKYKLDLVTTSPHVYNVIERTKKDKNGKQKVKRKELMVGTPFRAIRSLNRLTKGEVYRPVLYPAAWRMEASIAQVEPLPLVPATWTNLNLSWGSPRSPSSSLVRERPSLVPFQ